MAAHALSVIDSYIDGFAQQQQNLTYNTSEEAAEVAENVLRQIPSDQYTHLAELITEHAMNPGYDYAHEFEFGLDRTLAGLERSRRNARN